MVKEGKKLTFKPHKTYIYNANAPTLSKWSQRNLKNKRIKNNFKIEYWKL